MAAPSTATVSMYVLWNKSNGCSLYKTVDDTMYLMCSADIDTVSNFRKECQTLKKFKGDGFVILRGEFIAEEEL